jgi:hypothetical protein
LTAAEPRPRSGRLQGFRRVADPRERIRDLGSEVLSALVQLPVVVWSDRHRLHEPGGEIWVGVRTAGTEIHARAEAIRSVFEDAGARFVPAEPHADEHLLAVHDETLDEFLRSAWADWVAAGLPDDPGQDRVVPYVFPHPGLVEHVIRSCRQRPGLAPARSVSTR